MKNVKVAKLGGVVVEVCVNDDASMEEVLRAASMDSTGFTIKVNGRTPCGTIEDRDVITLVPEIKAGGEILVKIAKLGGEVKELMLVEGQSVCGALEIADIDPTGFTVKVNGRTSSEDAGLRNGDIITLVPEIKAGSGIMVKIAKLGGEVKEVLLVEGSDVDDALESADIDAVGFTVKVNGRTSDTGMALRNGDIVTLVPEIKAGK